METGEIPIFPDEMELYNTTFVKYKFNNELHKGDLTKVPLECLLSFYILKNEAEMFFIDVTDQEKFNSFDIIHLSPISDGEFIEMHVHAGLDAQATAQWLRDRLIMKDYIYIPKRKKFDKLEFVGE